MHWPAISSRGEEGLSRQMDVRAPAPLHHWYSRLEAPQPRGLAVRGRAGGRSTGRCEWRSSEVQAAAQGGGSADTAREVRAGAGGRKQRERNRTNLSFSTYRWHWWVIYLNSSKFGFGGAPLEILHKNHGVGACSTYFLEQICSGVGGAEHVWMKKLVAELVFQIWSCVELWQIRP